MWSSEVITWGLGMVLVGVLLMLFINWIRSKNIETKWYDWLTGGIGSFLLIFMVQNIYGSIAEREMTAAWMMLLFLGIPAIIFLAIAWQLVARRNKA